LEAEDHGSSYRPRRELWAFAEVPGVVRQRAG